MPILGRSSKAWQRYPMPAQLDAYAVDRLGALPEGRSLVIDLSKTKFIKPAGMTVLYWLVRGLREAGREVRLEIGSQDVASYLCRMNFHVPFRQDAGCSFEPNLQKMKVPKAYGAADRLMEFRLVAVTNDTDVTDAGKQILGIVETNAPAFVEARDELFTAITELLSNVERHSGVRETSVVAQSHKDCVRIAVGDCGRGIRASLTTTRKAQIESLPDYRVNLLATEPGVTGSLMGGGYGLTTIRDLVQERGQALHIISGSGRASILRSLMAGRQLQFAVPGTVVEVSLARG